MLRPELVSPDLQYYYVSPRNAACRSTFLSARSDINNNSILAALLCDVRMNNFHQSEDLPFSSYKLPVTLENYIAGEGDSLRDWSNIDVLTHSESNDN